MATSSQSRVDISLNSSPHSLSNKVGRVLWGLVWSILFRPTPRIMYGWRRMLLQLFGATMAPHSTVFGSTRIWAPWNLEMGSYACLSERVEVLNVSKVRLGDHATVSQFSYLCSASHDFDDPAMPVVSSPIVIGDGAWVCADVFIGPGVSVGNNCVISARATVLEDIPSDTIAAGNPARPIRIRQ